MRNFEYYTPTRVIFGKDTHLQAGSLLKEYGAKKVLIHFGGQSAVRSGLIDELKANLEEAGLEYVTLGGVVPNPHLSKVREGIELCKKENVDFILAVGGGSSIDTAKAVAHGAANPEEALWDIWTKKVPLTKSLPVGAVLTIPATMITPTRRRTSLKPLSPVKPNPYSRIKTAMRQWITALSSPPSTRPNRMRKRTAPQRTGLPLPFPSPRRQARPLLT